MERVAICDNVRQCATIRPHCHRWQSPSPLPAFGLAWFAWCRMSGTHAQKLQRDGVRRKRRRVAWVDATPAPPRGEGVRGESGGACAYTPPPTNFSSQKSPFLTSITFPSQIFPSQTFCKRILTGTSPWPYFSHGRIKRNDNQCGGVSEIRQASRLR